ncbi:MAG: ATP-dependent helicase [Patescibacteria group bacterium]
MIDFAKELNKEQLEIIQNGDGYSLVLAGAGSGKTRVITYRVAYLLEKGVKPENILLLTFTNKAADEMTQRIVKLNALEKKMPWAGTFHHIAYKILLKYSTLIGYQNNFSILDSEDSRDLIKFCLKTENIKSTYKKFPAPKVLQSIFSYAKNSNSTVENILEKNYPNYLDFKEDIVSVFALYDQKKKIANVMDFDDLLTNLYLLLLTKKEIKNKLAEQFHYILVDEYQDTNKIQALIIEELSSIHKNLLVVGDDAQSIYSFRAAEIKNILDFEEKKQAKVFKLETNYRSTPEILDLANDVIKNNNYQYEKKLVSVQNFFTRPELTAFANNEEEAEFISSRILEFVEEGISPDKIAVLFRAAFHSQALEMELSRRNIVYDFRGGVRFFERAHVKDVLAFLKILNNKNDETAWQRILNMQSGIGPAGATKIIDFIQKQDSIKYEDVKNLLGAKAGLGWTDFWEIFEKIKDVSKNQPTILIKNILQSNYQNYLESEYEDYRERNEDLKQMAFFAEKYNSLEEFLAEATLQESYNREQNSDVITKKDKIILSTIHQAKGLEWDVVFIIGLAQGMFPSDRIKNFSELEEERRLFYVSITRAKKYLYLTYPAVNSVFASMSGPSIFLQELNLNLVKNDSDSFSENFFDPSDDIDNVRYVSEDGPRTSFLKSIDEL